MLVVGSLLLTFLLVLPYREQVKLATTLAPIDDPLLEAYAKAVVDKHGPELLAQFQGNPPVFRIKDEFFQKLESEYSSEPRFWQLRYLTDADKLPASYNLYKYRAGYREYYLGRAMQDGVYDAATLVLWIDSLLDDSYRGAYTSNEAHRQKALSDDPTAQYRYAAEVAYQGHEQEVRAFIDRLIKEYPDEGWGYLIAAECEFYTGDHAAAVERLQQFTDANSHNRLEPFPLNVNSKMLEQGKSIGNPAFSGLMDHLEGYHGNFVVKEAIAPMLSSLTQEAVQRQDLHQLASLHDAFVQLAQMRGVEFEFKRSIVWYYNLFVSPSNTLKINYNPDAPAERDYLYNFYWGYQVQYNSIQFKLRDDQSYKNVTKSNASKIALKVFHAKYWAERYASNWQADCDAMRFMYQQPNTSGFKEFAAIDFSKLHCDGVWGPDEEK